MTYLPLDPKFTLFPGDRPGTIFSYATGRHMGDVRELISACDKGPEIRETLTPPLGHGIKLICEPPGEAEETLLFEPGASAWQYDGSLLKRRIGLSRDSLRLDLPAGTRFRWEAVSIAT